MMPLDVLPGLSLDESATRRRLHKTLFVASMSVFLISIFEIVIASQIATLADNIIPPIAAAVMCR